MSDLQPQSARIIQPGSLGSKKQPNQWMTTFADLLSLLLTFFILLFSMSELKQREWDELTSSLSGRLNPAHVPVSIQDDDTKPPPRITQDVALHLSYVENLLKKQFAENLGKEISLELENDRLFLQLSSDSLFKSGSADFSERGLPIVRKVSNAVARLPNTIEIVGHTDPRPITTNEYPSNWELSIARAHAVTQLIQGGGYTQDIDMFGMADGRYSEIDATRYKTESSRFRQARRVDVVIRAQSN